VTGFDLAWEGWSWDAAPRHRSTLQRTCARVFIWSILLKFTM
jgi:hypothetical protein